MIQRFQYYETDYLRHPIYRAMRAAAMRRTNGRCSECGDLATEVHHVRYPKPWGAFDTPSNLNPICHACHCRLEGKPL